MRRHRSLPILLLAILLLTGCSSGGIKTGERHVGTVRFTDGGSAEVVEVECIKPPLFSQALSPSPKNKPWVGSRKPIDRASIKLGDRELSDGLFVGLALSGGGSRAAVFGAEVMHELEEEGILQHVDVITSVSGGCLPAAYYSLPGNDWSRESVRSAMSQDIRRKMIRKSLQPLTLLRYHVLGTLNRADLLAQVLDDLYFHGKTFSELASDRPKLLIDALAVSPFFSGFPFTEEAFEFIGSDLASYPISYAVAASLSVPGKIQPVPVERFPMPVELFNKLFSHYGLPTKLYEREWKHLSGQKDQEECGGPPPRKFLHLSDAGVIDNMAFNSQADVIQAHSRRTHFAKNTGQFEIKNCLVIVVDSTVSGALLPPYTTDGLRLQLLRQPEAPLEDPLARAADALLFSAHEAWMRYVGLYNAGWDDPPLIETEFALRPRGDPTGPREPPGLSVPPTKCLIWHIWLGHPFFFSHMESPRSLGKDWESYWYITKDSDQDTAEDLWMKTEDSGMPVLLPKGLQKPLREIKTDLRIQDYETGAMFYAAKCLVHDTRVLPEVCSLLGGCHSRWKGKGCQHVPKSVISPAGEILGGVQFKEQATNVTKQLKVHRFTKEDGRILSNVQ